MNKHVATAGLTIFLVGILWVALFVMEADHKRVMQGLEDRIVVLENKKPIFAIPTLAPEKEVLVFPVLSDSQEVHAGEKWYMPISNPSPWITQEDIDNRFRTVIDAADGWVKVDAGIGVWEEEEFLRIFKKIKE